MHDAPIGLATLIGIYFVGIEDSGKRSESQDARCPHRGHGIYFVGIEDSDAQGRRFPNNITSSSMDITTYELLFSTKRYQKVDIRARYPRIFYNIYKNIEHATSVEHDLRIMKTTRITKLKDVIKPSMGYLPSFASYHINTFSKNYITFLYNSPFNKSVTIHFIVEEMNINAKIYKEHAEKIMSLLYFLALYATKKKCTNKHLVIYIYMTSLAKEKPDKRNIDIGEKHVNTGYTIPCNNEVVIYRKEEWFKVLIHEMMHNYNLDFSGTQVDYQEKITEIMHIRIRVELFEAYSEFWAEMINGCFVAYSVDFDESYDSFMSMLYRIVQTELFFKVLQMVKVLSLKRTSYYKLLFTNCIDYSESTNILSYYVFATVLMFYFQDFISWCNKYNCNTIQFSNNKECITQFCEFIKSHCKCRELFDYVDYVEHIYRNDIRNKNTLLGNTLRMTIYG